MNLKSIRWRLPLTYAGIALITALVLGGTLLTILRSYYQDQETNYLEKNAVAIGGAVGPFMVKDSSGSYPIGDLKSHLALLAFLSQTRVRLLDPNGAVIVDYSFVGAQNPKAVLSAVSLPQPDGSSPPEKGLFVNSSGSITARPVPVQTLDPALTKNPAGVLAIQIFQQNGNAVQMKILRGSGPQTVAVPRNSENPGGPDVLFSVIPAVGTMYGFDLQGDVASSLARSNQTYRQAIFASNGTMLGSIVLSDGPSVGWDIVLGVARGWAIASFIGILIAALAGWFISRRMSKPILALTSVTTQMAGGDLSARATVLSRDEIGDLASSFNQMAGQLEATVETLRRFASDAAHELRTPLTALHTNLELARGDSALAEPLRSTLEQAWEQAQRMETLSRDLLDLSHLEAAPSSTPAESMDLAEAVGETCEVFASQAEQREITFCLRVPDWPVFVHGFPEQIRRMLSNLLENSLKFTPQGGRIEVILEENSGKAYLQVKDNGIGIPVEDLPYVLNRFHRGSNATGYRGSGLGLAIVQAIVSHHQGGIEIRPLDPGTQVTVWLPGKTRDNPGDNEKTVCHQGN